MNFVRSLAATAALALAMPVFAHIPMRTRANVPFDFEVNGRVLPAGHYTFESPRYDGVLVIRGEDGNAVMTPIVAVADTKEGKAPGISFSKRHGRVKLKEIRLADPAQDITYKVR